MVSFDELKSRQEKVAVVGLGYVGLPLAISLAKHFSVIGFDIKTDRVKELNGGYDRTREVGETELKKSGIFFCSDASELQKAKFIIVAVPTPVKDTSVPDMSLLEKASAMVGKNLSKGAVVVFESTVYPGATEEICMPILEQSSGLKAGVDFKLGYSPERVNPGDKLHVIEKVTKVVSAMDEEALELVAAVYGSITQVFKAKSIKVAEAAKVIENTQRDLNIALMNELARIFTKMDIGVYDVLEAAGTKWNFLKFTPGLVGGHCIGVDPYYLTHKAQQLGYEPEVILAGRKINDSMGAWITGQVVIKLEEKNPSLSKPSALVAGITFKENVPDIRNSKVIDIYNELINRGISPVVYDPVADPAEVKAEYGIELSAINDNQNFDLVILAVPHEEIKKQPINFWQRLLKPQGCLADIKGIYAGSAPGDLTINYWTL